MVLINQETTPPETLSPAAENAPRVGGVFAAQWDQSPEEVFFASDWFVSGIAT